MVIKAWGFLVCHFSDVPPKKYFPSTLKDFPCGLDGKPSVYNEGDLGSIPGSGRYPGGGNGNPLQYSLLENSMDRGFWQTTVHGVAKSQTPLND